MDSCPWTVRLHRAKEEQGRSRLHQSRDFMLMLCLHSATKEKRCDETTDVFHKLSQFSSSGIDDDMEILVRFVSECMTDPAQLRASTMQDWVCLRGAVTRRATVFQPDIASSTGYGQYLADLLDIPSTTAGRCQQLIKCDCKSVCHGWYKCHRLGLTCTTLCTMQLLPGFTLRSCNLKLLCSLPHDSILLLSSFISTYFFGQAWDRRTEYV